ncbi:MAG: type I-E CRISPR-associated protein Cse2/CasB [Candidatus Lokiarchaeota archaeon]|nr:type I-E CRISPR-associated protein Cse2/CasB [Candidatus Lokiarchaeota archaeon]
MSKNKLEKKEKKSKFEISKSSFIGYLEDMKKREDRGALAALRRGLQYELGECIDMYPYVIPWIKNIKSKWEKNMHFLIASLYAYYPETTNRGNLGDVFRKLYLKRKNNKSLEQRFISLLKSNPEDLPFHVRQAVSLAKSENIPINWNELFYDLKRWPYETRFPPYEKWAKSFWKRKTNEEENKNE